MAWSGCFAYITPGTLVNHSIYDVNSSIAAPKSLQSSPRIPPMAKPALFSLDIQSGCRNVFFFANKKKGKEEAHRRVFAYNPTRAHRRPSNLFSIYFRIPLLPIYTTPTRLSWLKETLTRNFVDEGRLTNLFKSKWKMKGKENGDKTNARVRPETSEKARVAHNRRRRKKNA